MGFDIKVAGDLVGVSGLRQADATTAQTINKALLFDEASGVVLNEVREHNQGEKTGQIEPTEVDVKDRHAEGTLTMEKATPDGLGWAFAMATGDHAAAAAGTGFLHTSKLLTYPEQPSYFTVAHRRGGASGAPADYRRHTGVAINVLNFVARKGEFVSLGLSLLGLGLFDDAIDTQIIVAANNATSLTLAQDPKGDDPTNVTVWADLDADGQYEKAVIVGTYNPGTNALAITSLAGGGGNINYRVTYPRKSADIAWAAALEALTPATEFKLKAANLQILPAIKYTEPGGVPTKGTTGQVALCEVESFEYEMNWNGQPGKCWRVGSTEAANAASVELGDTLQTIRVDRRVRDYLFRQHFDANSHFGMYVDAIGPEYEPGQRFEFRLWIPKVKLLTRPFKVSEGKWVEEGNLVVLKDTTPYATAIAQVRNLVATYVA